MRSLHSCLLLCFSLRLQDGTPEDRRNVRGPLKAQPRYSTLVRDSSAVIPEASDSNAMLLCSLCLGS